MLLQLPALALLALVLASGGPPGATAVPLADCESLGASLKHSTLFVDEYAGQRFGLAFLPHLKCAECRLRLRR